MRTVVAIVAGALLALGSASWIAAQPAPPTAIVPGRAVGPFRVGMPVEEARSMMEQFGRVEPLEAEEARGFCNPEPNAGVCILDRYRRVGLDTPGLVGMIVTDDPRFVTEPGGHKAGAPLLDFLRTFGIYTASAGPDPTEVRWDPQGLVVFVSTNQSGLAAVAIGVFSAR